LLYNNALELHSGLAAQSTEEYIKDLILSIAADNISNGNHLKLITHEHSTPWGAERSFINRLELFLLDLKLTHKGRPHKFLEETLSREVGKDLRQSSLFYFTPLVAHPSTEETFEYILTLDNLGVPIKIMAINPYSFVDKHFQYGNFSGVKGHIVATQKLIEKWRPTFRKRGISFFVIDVDPKLSLNEKVQKAWRDFEAKI
jgi:hypothetical protein